jgi:hypothetical protein
LDVRFVPEADIVLTFDDRDHRTVADGVRHGWIKAGHPAMSD